MNTGLILHTVLGLLLLLIPAGALYLLERKALKSFGIAIVRMVLQLLVLCVMVWALIRVDNPWLLILWLLLMAVYSAWIVISRCRNQGISRVISFRIMSQSSSFPLAQVYSWACWR